MSPFSETPSEILLDILELAGHEPWGIFCSDYATLRACALVCKAWKHFAQAVLFRNAVFDTCDDGHPDRFSKFYNTLLHLSLQGSPLLNCVRTLSVDCGIAEIHRDSADPLDPEEIHHADLHQVAQAISLCPNLRHLQIFIINEVVQFIRFDESDLALLRAAPLVTHLSVIGAIDDDVLLRQLLDVWPAITHLTVEFSGCYVKAAEAPSLSLECLQSLDEPPSEFIQHLIHSPTVSLKTLRLHTVSDLESSIRPFVDTLSELFLGFPESSSDSQPQPLSQFPDTDRDAEELVKRAWPVADVLSDCKHLRRFAVGAPLTPELLKALPRTVCDLGFSPHLCQDEDIQIIMDYLAAHPTIRTVSMQVYRNSMALYPHCLNVTAPLRRFCEKRGVELVQKEMEYCLFPNMD